MNTNSRFMRTRHSVAGLMPLVLATALAALPSVVYAIDSDGDSLDDSVETNTGVYISPTNTGTNPNSPDSDGDGVGDWYEVAAISSTSITAPSNAPNDPSIKPNVPYPLPAPDASTGTTNKPVKVYIFSGQSNMEGQGSISPLGTLGTLNTITQTDHKFPNLRNGAVLDAAGFSVRNDVRYRGVVSTSAVGNDNLKVGQGASTSSIGPELGFGHVMGYFHDEPVLIIKTCQGGRSLGGDFLPPGSVQYDYSNGRTYPGYGVSPDWWTTGTTPVPTTWYAGYQYDQCFLDDADMVAPAWADATSYINGATFPSQVRSYGQAYRCKANHTSSPTTEPGIGAQWATYWTKVFNVVDVLDNFATEYPQWAAQGFEIAGFGWFQGWNDGLSYTGQYYYRYEQNMAQFIRKVREYYAARYPGKINPKAPFVVSAVGFGGWSATPSTGRDALINGQFAVGNPVHYPEFAGNVKSVETRGYYRDPSESPANNQSHYNLNAETYMLVGDSMGRAMIDLMGTSGADTYPPELYTTKPADYATSVPADIDIAATFNEPIAIGTGNLTLRNLTDSTDLVIPVTDTARVSVSGSTLTLNPTANLIAGKSYAVRIDSTAITDLAGNPFHGIADYTTWNFTATTPDTTPPTPDPIAWASPPAGISSTAITMAASNATDPNGVQYYFTCTSGGGHDSGWQYGAAYTDSGLLPFSTCSYTVKTRDLSPGLNQGGSSAPASATTLSPPPGDIGGPVIYEPFAGTTVGSALVGQPTTLNGLTGNWNETSSMLVASGSLNYGSLPTSGNSLRNSDRRQGNYASIAPGTLSNAGLLADGNEMWFSLIHKIGPANNANAYWGFAIATDNMSYSTYTAGSTNHINGDGLGVGFRITNTDQLTAGIWNKPYNVETYNAGNPVDLAPGPGGTTFGSTILIVGKCSWGADGTSADKVEIYLPDPSMNLGSPVSTVSAPLDQKLLDTIAFMSSVNSPGANYYNIDEIRVGATYNDVIAKYNSYANWASGYSLGGLNGFNDDADGDGIPNGVENYFGTNPAIKNPGLAVISASPGSPGNFTFAHPLNPKPVGDVIGSYRWSTDLQTFHDNGQTDAGGTKVSFTRDAPVSGIATVHANVTGTPAQKLFVSVRASQNP